MYFPQTHNTSTSYSPTTRSLQVMQTLNIHLSTKLFGFPYQPSPQLHLHIRYNRIIVPPQTPQHPRQSTISHNILLTPHGCASSPHKLLDSYMENVLKSINNHSHTSQNYYTTHTTYAPPLGPIDIIISPSSPKLARHGHNLPPPTLSNRLTPISKPTPSM